MIDDETLAALEICLSVKLAVLPAARFRELAQRHGADSARQRLAKELAASLAGPFDIAHTARRAAWPTTPGPSDGRKSWADPPITPPPDKDRPSG
ncbi:hypothetical protein [Hyphomonas sp.]|uniref:hypothetical protein n=1 Tax=Hyphomonas sp. TaxID=87 RepID=UPI0025B83D66|nr:hypothetical protein [Hyphomonas sp.]